MAKKEEEKLNDRQVALKTLIHINSFVECRKTTQKEICDKIDGYVWNTNDKVHDHCSLIWEDINTINSNTIRNNNEGYIITKKNEYWIGTRKETETYLEDLIERIKPSLFRAIQLKRYLKKDGQYDLFKEMFNEFFKEKEEKESEN